MPFRTSASRRGSPGARRANVSALMCPSRIACPEDCFTHIEQRRLQRVVDEEPRRVRAARRVIGLIQDR